ncbi:MAG TPA: FecR family protein [Vicinamibacterales bacterium]
MIDEEDLTARLLRLAAGPRDASPERIAGVRDAVHRQWQIGRRRRMIRRTAAIAALGIAASVVIAVWLHRPGLVETPHDRVAIARRVEGRPLIVRPTQRHDVGQPLTASASVEAAAFIETDDASRAALQTPEGYSVRIDRASRVRFLAPAVLEVQAGAVYIASTDGQHGFEVRTPLGNLRDMGTQFEVRLAVSSLRLRVRTGVVEIRRRARVTTAAAGTEATITSSDVDIRLVPVFGSEWAWTTDIAPQFPIEGRTLRAFLEHTATEEGWTLHYAQPDLADAAARIVLHGSVDGLKAQDALQVVLATSGLRYSLRDGELAVGRAVER